MRYTNTEIDRQMANAKSLIDQANQELPRTLENSRRADLLANQRDEASHKYHVLRVMRTMPAARRSWALAEAELNIERSAA